MKKISTIESFSKTVVPEVVVPKINQLILNQEELISWIINIKDRVEILENKGTGNDTN